MVYLSWGKQHLEWWIILFGFQRVQHLAEDQTTCLWRIDQSDLLHPRLKTSRSEHDAREVGGGTTGTCIAVSMTSETNGWVNTLRECCFVIHTPQKCYGENRTSLHSTATHPGALFGPSPLGGTGLLVWDFTGTRCNVQVKFKYLCSLEVGIHTSSF